MKKLNIGCGEFPIKDFINLDVYEGKGVDVVTNATKLPFKDNEIDYIYFGHCIEHNTLTEARKILKECLRVLKTGCEIGIVIPDKDKTPEHLIKGDTTDGRKYKKHNSYWDLEMLKKEVKNAGFEDIETMNIDIYPNLVARPHWQSGVIAIKGGKKMEKEKKKDKEVEQEIPKFNEREYSWCKHEKKVIYNPTKKKHCSQCGRLL